MGFNVKRATYLADLMDVVNQVQTKWDCDKMRDRLALARENLERKYEALKRAEFSIRLGQQKP